MIHILLSTLLWAQTPTGLNLNFDSKSYQPGQADITLMMKEANRKLGSVNQVQSAKGCVIDYSIAKDVNLEEDYVCFAPPKKTFTEWVFDPNDKVSYEITNANDANLLNLKNEGKPGKKLSNDTGYTSGLNAKVSRENDERLISFEIDSKLYTAHAIGPDGKKRSPEGKLYLDTYEIGRINVNLEDKSRNDNLRAVGRVGLRMDSTDSNGLGAQVQQKWHDDLKRYKNLRYEQLAGGSSNLTLEAQVGLKKILETDISQIRCMAAGTVMVGMDSSGKPLLTTKLEAQATTGSMGGRNTSTPLFLVRALQEVHRTGRETTKEERIELGSYVYTGKNFAVYAAAGRGRHVTNGAASILKDKEMINYFIVKVEDR